MEGNNRIDLVCILALVFWLNISLAQKNQSILFNRFEPSQLSNYYIHRITDGDAILISSIDGLNIFDGRQMRVYRPSTHNMYGYNIQSPFFEDTSGGIWFSTYEALHLFDPKQDEFKYYFMYSEKGDTIRENYKVFHLDHNNLYLKAGTNIFVFDIREKQIVSNYPIDFSEIFHIALISGENGNVIVGGNEKGYFVYNLLEGYKTKLLDSGDDTIGFIYPDQNNKIWLGHGNGNLSLYDPIKDERIFQVKISELPINGITASSNSKLMITTGSNHILEFDKETRTISNKVFPFHTLTKESISQLLPPYLDSDSTLWVGGDGQGVFFSNLNKQKFKHYLKSAFGQQPVSVARILDWKDDSFIVLTRKNGIIGMNKNGDIQFHIRDLPNGRDRFTAFTGLLLNEDQVLFSDYYVLYILTISTGRITTLSGDLSTYVPEFAQLDLLPDGRIIASCGSLGLVQVAINDMRYSLTPYSDVSGYSKMTTYFKMDAQENLYVGSDEVDLLVLKPTPDKMSHVYEYTLQIAGIRSLIDDPKNNAIYITNSQGLFHVDLTTKKHNPIIDPNQHLLQNIYSGLMDDYGNLWLGTNNGLMKYYPANGEVKVFSEMDGVQAREFNSHAYLKTSDGHMLFGGVNGINYFHPREVKLSEREAPIYISEVLINDEFDTTFRVPQYQQEYDLTYGQNTISFEFHAIDYADPDATRVQYKMIGVDEHYIESKTAQGFARYSNLDPGEYTLSIVGRNSDGAVNKTAREVVIRIYPPFWLTWWFISLVVLSGAGILYWTIRSHFQRKLARKNQLLREQSLIIEKQQAVEHERTRIASEMHDDLGSGLTTIRYLSDKALHQAKDPEEAKQIKRIAEHSNALVRNMSEIIWAMNSRFDNAENLVGYLRRYASEYLDEHQMPLTFTAEDENLNVITIGGEKRRNIFLVFKEILHNSIKYSKASGIKINIQIKDNLEIHISEIDGKGFDPDDLLEKGNGLFNCRKRMATIQGQINFKRTEEAMHIILTVPLN